MGWVAKGKAPWFGGKGSPKGDSRLLCSPIAMTLTRPRRPARPRRTALWFERAMALIALVNLALVLFDLSYIRFRDLYLRVVPDLTVWYGETLKGIEPERSTSTYLATVVALETQVAATGLQSSEAEELLAELRQRSQAMVDDNPFQVANKSGTLERIKNLIRDRMGRESAKDSFERFWSREYLATAGWSQEIQFFNQTLRPLIETNYFRGIGEDGNPRDDFWWRVDSWFVALFALELIARSVYLSRRYSNTNLLDAVLLRWYDLLFFIPFWRWLRVIPTLLRLSHSRLINLAPVQSRLNHVFVTTFAVELTEVVILRVIDQVQNSLREGALSQWATRPQRQPYINLSGIDEVEVMTAKLLDLAVKRVLPQVQPEVEAIALHAVTSTLDQSPAYRTLRQLPGIGPLPEQMGQQLVTQLTTAFYGALVAALEDEKGAALSQALVSRLREALRTEAQRGKTLQELETLLTTWLDEVKVNYVRQLETEDLDRLMEENYRIYNLTQEKG